MSRLDPTVWAGQPDVSGADGLLSTSRTGATG